MTQIESKIKSRAKLKDIQLTEREDGKYEGTGTGKNGLGYKIKATYSYTDSGNKAEYKFHFDAEDSNGNVTGGTETADGSDGNSETVTGPKPK